MKKIWGMLLIFSLLLVVGCGKEEKPEQAMDTYAKAWNEKKFDKMYDQLSKEAKQSISKDDFVKKYENVYTGIAVKNLKVVAEPKKEDKKDEKSNANVPFKVNMDTIGGKISFENEAKLVKEKDGDKEVWKVDWNPSFIFPTMKQDDKVLVQSFSPKRGEIYDRDGNRLATNGKAAEVGIVPGKLGDSAQQTKETLAKLLQIPVEDIEKKLTAKWVQPSYYVPLSVLPEGANENDYISMPGVKTSSVNVRTYPLGEAAAHLTGYMGKVNAEDLKKLEGKGYKADDPIGRTGLENVFEDKLRGEKGGRVYIVDAKGKELKELAKKQAKDGENITLTIDGNLQQKIYAEMKGEAGSSAAVHPKTGETLALVSSPSYNPNVMMRESAKAEREALSNDQKKPMTNRFTQVYAPGSVFKPITGAIGLETKALDPKESLKIDGVKWAKDSSWGNYYVTRVKDANPVDFEKAMMYSDNIYFAQEALKIGKDKFAEEAKKFGLGEKLPIEYGFATSQIAKNGMKNDIQLADTGYGQGEVLMSSLHVALSYAPIVNEGNIPSPHLVKDDKQVKAWKEKVVSKENNDILKNSLIKVVNDPEGTGKIAKLDGITLAGKTGTAELKESKEADGKELGWFVAFDANSPNMIVAMMIEDVKGRGGSSIPAEKVKHVFQK
ncbi:penicillin-binding transpeptidase domain-containing protein [Bacillus cytotoxicus]|uniref:Penicillin-binding transpeptidase domain-containing protein n=1 Tax=Bacillus cytotoxicus TaxID=580165 RepID=A0ACC6A6Y9_9BACI|nr:penicillin-binding transpeptidase domain-containing protein [Bacillus cytotoxicus]